ncbi:NAD(P)-binding protein [Penicillium subrubescens]|nr:NAD(P)-binding protein [Penicillium subrubescens]KAJ5896802.1 NAD(P)-binding protein [Penicillium subrubescens]
MQVLVLGGHGKVARYLTPLLLNRAWNVTSVVRKAEHEDDIMSLGEGRKGKVNVLVSSLDQVKSASDAQKILDTVSPDYVVWSAGAGGKGGPESTIAVDQEAAKHFLSASFASAYVTELDGDAPATRKVQLGRTAGRGGVTREDVAIVADQLLASADAKGWIDLINGDMPVEVAVEKVGNGKYDAVEGEDVEGMVRRFFP